MQTATVTVTKVHISAYRHLSSPPRPVFVLDLRSLAACMHRQNGLMVAIRCDSGTDHMLTDAISHLVEE